MAIFVLFMNYQGVYPIEGVNYYRFEAWVLTDDFLPSFGAANLQRAISAAIPDASLCSYFPAELEEGEPVAGWSGSWVSPTDLYLLGAELQGGLGFESKFFDKTKYLVAIVTLYYTEYPPHELGITLLPGWSLPDTANQVEFPLGTGWSAYLDKGMNFDWREIARRRSDTTYCELFPCMAWPFTGCTAESAHIFGHYWDGDLIEGPDVAYFGRRFYAFHSYQVREDWIYDWEAPDWPDIRWYSPTSNAFIEVWLSFSDGLLLPSGIFPSGGGKRSIPPWLRNAISGQGEHAKMAPRDYWPGAHVLTVDGEALTIDDEPLEVIG